MNSQQREREKMLAEAFHGEWSHGPSAQFAQRAAAAARRREGDRAMLLAAGAAAGIAATLLFSFRQTEAMRPSSATVPPAAASYEVISDAELLAKLTDRPLLVIRPGDRAAEFLLLEDFDETEPSQRESE